MNSWDKFYDVNIEDLDKHDLGKYDFDTEIDSDSDDDNYDDNDLTGVVTWILDNNDDETDDDDLNNLELTTF